ncbi:MAG: ATP-dependent zinc metalloprotease FtsH [Bacteroidota bacterium]|nr:ATP-dependent zinc metalloprotease FtsH [Bacteroidota bacterium]
MIDPDNNNPDAEKPKSPRKGFRLWWVYIAALLFIWIVPLINNANKEQEITFQQFQNNILTRNAVEKIVIVNNEKAEIYIKKEMQNDSVLRKVFNLPKENNLVQGPQFYIIIGSPETFERKLDEAEKNFSANNMIPVSYQKRTNWIWGIVGWVLPFILIFAFWNFLLRGRGGIGGGGGASIFNFGKSTATLIEKQKSTITFADVAGLDEAQVEVKEIVDFLKNPESFTRLGAKIPKGIILIGPPGTGKTLLAKAVAGEAQVPFFSISGSEFVEMFVGIGASRVRDLFKRAKEKAPCIIFIDEIDAIGRSRGKGAFMNSSNDERESTLNQLLTEMDGFGTNNGVIVLAATNRADMLDPALLRPGRFDRNIYLELPNIKEREAIFKVHLRPIVYDNSIDLHFLASQTPGFSGADIANICNEAALIAARRKKTIVENIDFTDAIERVVAGLERRGNLISPSEKKTIAYHEAGHAVVSWLLKQVDPLVKVSIIPRGKSLGAAMYLPEEKQLHSKTYFKEHLCATLGGRAAEEIVFGEISSGALDDLEKVTKEAYMMVAYFGFDKKIGNVSFYDSSGQRDMGIQKPYSEETEKIIDEQVRLLINDAYTQAKDILEKNKTSLQNIAELLLKKEVIYKEDIEKILGKREQENEAPSVNGEVAIASPTK